MTRIITVCTGNICRSPMAEYLIRRAVERADLPEVTVESFGISDEERGNPVDPRAARVLQAEGIDASGHRARQVTAADLAAADLVLALDLPHERALRSLAETERDAEKIHLLREFDPEAAHLKHRSLGIYDPWYGDEEDFETTFEMIDAAVPGVVDWAREHGPADAETARG
ncbi:MULTISPECIES: low molecular weight protein-tyrosine-phosphatase [Rothia]|uniref:protein-tyrosine-phosphatase n=1 Tax=Rothia kristinae TaxID=37923 RepID=A0A7T3CJL8_9MICC|nr:low molecular weight protein-tyrosine-phosphatase [Rothia kristinae]KTR39246.1 hypothetical protein RSA5_02905 [Rothia kristinae]KTR68053.1 hypothetical protein SA12R_05305 [Rothia kristinae]KTR76344.1 hypothetical protein SA14R_07260 [Rothia kristinae]KTR81265.1 hypothetical protein RSA28_02165 [Rothia kristinae]KTR94039.1 hypothetical protein SA13R_04740 [Rothia kristinae]